MTKIGAINKSVFNKILIFIILPVLIIFVASLFVNYIYSENLKNTIVEQHNKSLSSTVSAVNQLQNHVLKAANMLMLDENVVNIMYSQDGKVHLESAEIYSVISTLKKYKVISEFISGITIFDRYNGYVISDVTRSNSDLYFDNYYKYEKYPQSFWENYTVSSMKDYDVLSPTQKMGINKTVIPIVSSGFMGIKSKNLMIIDIDCKKIYEKFLDNNWPGYCNTFIYEMNEGIAVGNENNSLSLDIFEDRTFTEKVKGNASFSYNFKGKKYLVVTSYEDRSMLDGYIYISVTPEEELMKDFNKVKRHATTIILFAMICTCVLIYGLSNNLYEPIRGILVQLKGRNIDGDFGKVNEFDFIRHQMKTIIDANTSIRKQLDYALPLACEQCMLKFLNSSDEDILNEMEGFLHKSGISFELDYFSVSEIRLKYTDEFYKQFSNSEYQRINAGVADLFRLAFSVKYTSFLLPYGKDRFILIVNIANDLDSFDEIVEGMQNIIKLFDADKAFVRVNISVGKAYEGYEGMCKSYNEIQNASSVFLIQNNSVFSVANDSQNSLNEYKYDINDENKLFNYMVKGDWEAVRTYVDGIVNNNVEIGVNRINLRYLYQQLYNTAIKVLKTKGVEEAVLMQNDYIDIKMVLNVIEDDRLAEYVISLIKEATLYNNLTSTRMDMKGIIKYIDENFYKDIYLDIIAEKYNTSVKYLSRAIKSYLGMSFGEYLGRIRIENAKKLLRESNLSVNEIISQCGFNSRNTFIRAFKKYAGVVPSEYRNMYAPIEGSNADL